MIDKDHPIVEKYFSKDLLLHSFHPNFRKNRHFFKIRKIPFTFDWTRNCNKRLIICEMASTFCINTSACFSSRQCSVICTRKSSRIIRKDRSANVPCNA